MLGELNGFDVLLEERIGGVLRSPRAARSDGRGREYLRMIDGPEYLERFVRREPIRHVHQCVFGVLALEAHPVDPRL